MTIDNSVLKKMHNDLKNIVDTAFNDFSATYPAFHNFNQFLDAAKETDTVLFGKHCIDIGCGSGRPHSIASLLYLSGAASVLGIDIVLPDNHEDSASMALMTVLGAVLNHEHMGFERIGVSKDHVMSKLADFDLSRLLSLELEGAIPSVILQKKCFYQDLEESEKKFDIGVSHQVFEHIEHIGELLVELRANISNNGRIFAGIDYRDHRMYVDSSHGPWDYLFDDDGWQINKIRHTEMMRIITDSGFDVHISSVDRQHLPPDCFDRLLPKYRDLSSDDIEILSSRVMLLPARGSGSGSILKTGQDAFG
ncbi:methyltransferase domain-containing protein [Rhizobium lusitanum]|uniref:methyltransferase domain-containing protein n=1 Tax=Rhizobium lusitanum TaxID=293958 RepID=UPI00195867BA|nr:methyltransferase domain-containing protein [Rhizobium lusitanum]MBM7046438.1 methyltransferase domain-containing protein [Rhizobium lusitanum]